MAGVYRSHVAALRLQRETTGLGEECQLCGIAEADTTMLGLPVCMNCAKKYQAANPSLVIGSAAVPETITDMPITREFAQGASAPFFNVADAFDSSMNGYVGLQNKSQVNCVHHTLNNYLGAVEFPYRDCGGKVQGLKGALMAKEPNDWINACLDTLKSFPGFNTSTYRDVVMGIIGDGTANSDGTQRCCGAGLLNAINIMSGIDLERNPECLFEQGGLCELSIWDVFMLLSFRYSQVQQDGAWMHCLEFRPHNFVTHIREATDATWPPTGEYSKFTKGGGLYTKDVFNMGGSGQALHHVALKYDHKREHHAVIDSMTSKQRPAKDMEIDGSEGAMKGFMQYNVPPEIQASFVFTWPMFGYH